MQTDIHRVISYYLEENPPHLASLESITPHLSLIHEEKGRCLVEEGKTHNYVYFLLEGAARSYYLKEGLEVNSWFAFEDEMVGSLQNYLGKPSRVSIELLENSKLVCLQLDSMREALKKEAILNVFVRKILEEYTDFLEDRLFGLQHMSSMDRYTYLLETDKQIWDRVSLTHIASYLGMSRETLSRLRGKPTL